MRDIKQLGLVDQFVFDGTGPYVRRSDYDLVLAYLKVSEEQLHEQCDVTLKLLSQRKASHQ